MSRKLLIITCIIALSVMSVTGVFAGEKDGIYSRLADELTSLSSIQKILDGNNAKLQKVTDRLNTLQSQEETSSIQHKKKVLDSRTEALNKKGEAIAQEIEAKNQDIESMKAQLNDGEDVRAWHKKAKSQVVAWNYSANNKTMTLTILDKNKKTSSEKPARFRIRNNEKVYVADKLPEGLQGIIPEGWTVNFDEKAGVAKIEDVDNITGSALDNTARTFTSGEAFVILKTSAMTIKPAEQISQTDELNLDSESEQEPLIKLPVQPTPEYFEMPETQPVY
ncbi:MAG: hypothetical protein II917_05475 [Synergistaceae bacterium]|nr:hypothetical protein [Synergistaceae bacterium]